MKVFVTGASGWIGSAAVAELIAAGHEVEGLARSQASADAVARAGAGVRRGDLDDLDSIRAGAEAAEAVVHLANKHDFAHPEVSNAAERAAVETIIGALEGTDRPFLLASGLAVPGLGRPVAETDRSPADGPDSPRGGTENLALEAVDRGVGSVALRFAPTVHGPGDHGFIRVIADAARRAGFAAYGDDGAARWAAVARPDAGRAVALAVTRARPGDRLHVVGETGVTTKTIAEAIGRALDVPARSVPSAELTDVIGPIGSYFGLDMAGESAATRERLGWTPEGPTLEEDLASGAYTSD